MVMRVMDGVVVVVFYVEGEVIILFCENCNVSLIFKGFDLVFVWLGLYYLVDDFV